MDWNGILFSCAHPDGVLFAFVHPICFVHAAFLGCVRGVLLFGLVGSPMDCRSLARNVPILLKLCVVAPLLATLKRPTGSAPVRIAGGDERIAFGVGVGPNGIKHT